MENEDPYVTYRKMIDDYMAKVKEADAAYMALTEFYAKTWAEPEGE